MKNNNIYVKIRNDFYEGVGCMSYNLDFNMEQIREKKSDKEKFVASYYEVLSKRLVDETNTDMSLNEYSKRAGDRKAILDKISLEIEKINVSIQDIELECIKEEEKKGNISEEFAIKIMSNLNKEAMLDSNKRQAKLLEVTNEELTQLRDYRILLGKEVFTDRITTRELDTTKLNLKDINKDIYNINNKLGLIRLTLIDKKNAISVLTRDERKKNFNEKVKTFVKKIFK